MASKSSRRRGPRLSNRELILSSYSIRAIKSLVDYPWNLKKDERDWTWPDIGSLTEFDNAGYAEAMRKLAMDTGNECYATVGIAIMMDPSNAKRAASLYERAVAAGDERYATLYLAILISAEKPECAESLCERATSVGNESASIALMLASLEQRYGD